MASMKKTTIENDPTAVHNDAIRFGLQGVKSDVVGDHPLQLLQELMKSGQEKTKRVVLGNTYGTAFTAKMDLDRQILSSFLPKCVSLLGFVLPHQNLSSQHLGFHRPPGALPSSMLGLDAFNGSLDDFGFEDYLNDPKDSENFIPVDLHHGMEVRLGLSKGPVCPSFI